jgi:Phospholipase_D-nuclease N-terminal/Short C-terminal domain
MPIATDYPFLNILWSMLVFVGFIMWIWLAIMVFMDIFRRHDMNGFVKALWIILVIVIPLFGVLLYLLIYSRGIAERNAKDVAASQQAFDERVREAAGGPASEIEKAKSLLDSGAISQEEYDKIKASAISGS